MNRSLNAALASVLLAGCATVHVAPFVGPPDRTRFTPDQKVVWQASDEQDTAFQNIGADYDDSALQAYVQGVVDRLYPEFQGAIHVHLLKSTVPNAFMMANGSCYVQLGLLALLDNEAELATVLGHEGGHFIRQHGVQEHEYDENTAALGMVLGITIIGPAIAASSMYGYSRQMEVQADAIGFQRLNSAGYDVDQAPLAFEQLDAYSQALEIEEPYFFADHPKLEDRIKYFTIQAHQVHQIDGYVGAKEYLAATGKARLWVLQDALSRQDYRSIIFFLVHEQRIAEFPPEACYYLGRAFRLRDGENDKQKAESEFRNCTIQIPDFAPPYAALGKLLMEEDKNTAALIAFNKYLQIAPDAPDASYIQLYIKHLVSKQKPGDKP